MGVLAPSLTNYRVWRSHSSPWKVNFLTTADIGEYLHSLLSHNLGPAVIDGGKRQARSSPVSLEESGEAAVSDKGKPRGTSLVWSPA